MQAKTEKEGKEKEVAAAEDLMREHGILRRTLLVYGEAATRLTQRPDSVSPEALQRGAKLFRSFGEEYHESNSRKRSSSRHSKRKVEKLLHSRMY